MSPFARSSWICCRVLCEIGVHLRFRNVVFVSMRLQQNMFDCEQQLNLPDLRRKQWKKAKTIRYARAEKKEGRKKCITIFCSTKFNALRNFGHTCVKQTNPPFTGLNALQSATKNYWIKLLVVMYKQVLLFFYFFCVFLSFVNLRNCNIESDSKTLNHSIP